MATLSSLPDVNVLLALAWNSHPHHGAAHDWFSRAAANGWCTCLLTQSGFLRLSMNPLVVGVALNCHSAVNLLNGLVAHANHRYIDTLPALTAAPFDELVPNIAGYRQIPDATLLHVARSHNLKLTTFDSAIGTICPWNENVEILSP